MQVRTLSSIQRWHWGKVVFIWAWTLLLSAVLLRMFASIEVDIEKSLAIALLLVSLGILLFASTVTWIWLGSMDRSSDLSRPEIGAKTEDGADARVA